MTRTFIHIPVTGDAVTVTANDANILDQLQSLVGGFIEIVGLGDDANLYINEEGKLYDLPLNPRATILAAWNLLPGDYIAGDAVLVGPVDDEGEDTSAPDSFILAFTRSGAES